MEGSLLYLKTAFGVSITFFQAVNPTLFIVILCQFLDPLLLFSRCSLVLFFFLRPNLFDRGGIGEEAGFLLSREESLMQDRIPGL